MFTMRQGQPIFARKFSCSCPSSYIGETINVRARINQHFTPSHKGKPYLHITECEMYQKELSESGLDPKSFFQSRFKILEQNMDLRERKKLEAVHIVLDRPDLNIQVHHESISFV